MSDRQKSRRGTVTRIVTGIMGLMVGVLLLAWPQAWANGLDLADGKSLYVEQCQECHGLDGEGLEGDWQEPLPGPDLKYPPPPLDHSAHAWHHPDSQLAEIIAQGGEDGRMPSFKERLSGREIQAIIRYLHTLWKPEQFEWQQALGQLEPAEIKH
ncbi:MAG: cytochrome c [Magnetococcales bacterium]|nr:cytochrome c [Magnetococcales bacterium]